MKPPVDWEAKYHAEAAHNALMRTGLLAAKSLLGRIQIGSPYVSVEEVGRARLAVEISLKEVGSVAPKSSRKGAKDEM